MRRSRPAVASVFAASVAVLAVGCGTTAPQFRSDVDLRIVSPDNLATVSGGVRLSWELTGAAAADVGGYVVVVDRPPMPPGEGVGFFARGDGQCKPSRGCPDEPYLRDRNVYVTTGTSLDLPGFSDTRPRGRSGSQDRHDVTVVALDHKGLRRGEAASGVTVFVDRHPAGGPDLESP